MYSGGIQVRQLFSMDDTGRRAAASEFPVPDLLTGSPVCMDGLSRAFALSTEACTRACACVLGHVDSTM